MQGRVQGGGLICRITECPWRQYRSRVHALPIRFLTATTGKQRRRKHRPVLRQTTRTRIRLLLKDPVGKPAIAHVAKAATFLEARLKEAQNLVRGFWNPDAVRAGPAMDRWWWIQNVLLALTPAAMIVFAMELWGRPYVEKRSKEIELFNRLNLGLMHDEDNVEAEHETAVGSAETSSNTTQQPTHPQSSRQDSHPTLSHEALQVPAIAELSNDPTAADLQRRIQLLEQKLEKQHQELERLMRSQQQHRNQSGIQNRLDQKLILKDSEARKDASTKVSTPKEPAKLDMFTLAEAWISRNIREKRDAIMESGKQLLDLIHPEDSSKERVDDPGERLLMSHPSPKTENVAVVAGQTNPVPTKSTDVPSQLRSFPLPIPTEGQEKGWLSWYRLFPQRSQDALSNETDPESKPSSINKND